VYVEFDRTWPRVVAQLEKLKRAAKGTPGKIIAQGRCAMLPGGKPNYPFQVQFAEFQLWLSSKQVPERETPNVFISLGARLLWESGVRQAVEKALASLVELTDGTVRSCRMSRCDLTADFYWPQGLTDEFLRRYAVMRSRSTKLYLKDDQIESFYVGASDADIKLKIYHKSVEIVRSGKDWFRHLWNLDVLTGVWRVEFQTRRDLLRSLDIDSVDDLLAKAADLWRYLTTEWFSLRLLDDPNASRRSVHPWWETVQECDEQFGTVSGPCQRRQRQPSAQIEPLVRQIAGHFVGVAARTGLRTLEDVKALVGRSLDDVLQEAEFLTKVQLKALQLGLNATEGN
jgi:hypothetical protein